MLTTVNRRSDSPESLARTGGGVRACVALGLSFALPVALLVAATLLLPACGDDDDPTPPVCADDFCAPYVQPTSPANVLSNLKRAYEGRDIDMYALCFAPDFVFTFAPDDVSEGDTPPEWPLADEFESARNLFADETVDRIQFGSFVIPSSRPAVGSDSLPSIEGIQVIKVDEVRLSFFLRNEEGEVLELLVPGEPCAFFFRQDLVDGEQRWRLVRWRDKPRIGVARAGPATLERSWGSMKNLFH